MSYYSHDIPIGSWREDKQYTFEYDNFWLPYLQNNLAEKLGEKNEKKSEIENATNY